MFKGIGILLTVTFSTFVWAGPMMEINTQEALNNYISGGKFNGVVLVAKDNQILMKKAFGFKNLASNVPLSTGDKFLIGSNTKQFVAASILKLQEEGKLSLEDKITQYLPELTAWKNISIRDVLNHTSGIPNFTDIPDFWKGVDYDHTLSLDNILNFTIPYPLNFEAKANYKYSNTGYIVAGKIVEILSGKSWDQFIHDEFLSPLKMNDTGYETFYEKITDIAGHISYEGILVPFEKEFNTSWALSAGALYSTADDLLKWTKIYSDSKLLSEFSKKEMQTPFKADYGLGVTVSQYDNQTKINHSGRVPGFVSDFTFLKESKMAVITLDNVDGNFTVSNVVMDYFVKGRAITVKTNVYPVEADTLNDFTGTYQMKGLEVLVFIKDNKLFLKPNDNQPAYELVANDQDSFRLLPLNFGEEFVRDADGVVVELKHYQNGNVSLGKKKLSSN